MTNIQFRFDNFFKVDEYSV